MSLCELGTFPRPQAVLIQLFARGLIKLSKAVVLMVTVYYSEGCRSKLAKVIGQQPGGARYKLPGVLFHRRHVDSVYFSQ